MENCTYDFSRCKLCGENMSEPKYRLKKTTIFECAGCGFHFIDFLDVIADPGSAGSVPLDERAWNYIESRLAANETQHRKNLNLVGQHSPTAGQECLDIGAGAGVFSNLLAKGGASVAGIEPQQVFREFAQRKFGIILRGETIDHPLWQQAARERFDVVTLWDVLEHVNFPAEMLAHAYPVTKPGGWLFLDTPCRDSVFYRLSEWAYRLNGGKNGMLLESLYSAQPFRHKQIFTRAQLVKVVKSAGWQVVQMKAAPFTFQNKIVMACRKPVGVAGRSTTSLPPP